MSKKNQGNKDQQTKVEEQGKNTEQNNEQTGSQVEGSTEGSGNTEQSSPATVNTPNAGGDEDGAGDANVGSEDKAAGDAVANQEKIIAPGASKADEEVTVEEGELNLNCQTILAYAIAMAPNKPNDKLAILRKQMELYQAVTAIINNLEGAEFHKAYGEALNIMAEHAPTFADNMLFRGFNEMRIPKASSARFENILVLMSSTADPEGRAAALKAISFDTFAKDFGSDVEQKIRGFYR